MKRTYKSPTADADTVVVRPKRQSNDEGYLVVDMFADQIIQLSKETDDLVYTRQADSAYVLNRGYYRYWFSLEEPDAIHNLLAGLVRDGVDAQLHVRRSTDDSVPNPSP